MQVELFLLIISVLFFASILTDKIGSRFGVPALLLFLLVGMLFGSDGIGFNFNNLPLAQAISTVALCVILFSGGMDTKFSDVRPVMGPGITLATVGVLLTALLTGVIIWALLGWTHSALSVSLLTCLLMAATMSSTDSASVFSILRNQGIHLRHNLRPLLELESGSNDPVAYVLTTTLIGVVTAGSMPSIWSLLGIVLLQIIIGAIAGLLLGKFMVWGINKVKISNESLYPILVFTACIFIFSLTYFIKGNSYLAVYLGGLVIGNSKIAHKRSTMGFFDGLGWLCQLGLFLMLGLLVNPHELKDALIPGLIVSVVMIFITRPLSVVLCMLPFGKKYTLKDMTFVSWVGLRGAVPITFAILCLSAGVPHANLLFNIVFMCTLISLIVQGTSLPAMARALHLSEKPKELKRPTNFDIDLPDEIKSVATEIEVTEGMLVHGNKMMDLGLPSNTLVIMVRRGQHFFVPTGSSILHAGDQLLIITDNEETLHEAYQQIDRRRLWRPQFMDDTFEYLKAHYRRIQVKQAIKKNKKKKAQKS